MMMMVIIVVFVWCYNDNYDDHDLQNNKPEQVVIAVTL
jgi:nitrogen fixation-related uncharacterized protein